MDDERLSQMFNGYGWKPYFVEGSDPAAMHQLMAGTLDHIVEEICNLQEESRHNGKAELQWPMIILRSPKGWTGPKTVEIGRASCRERVEISVVADGLITMKVFD